MLERNGEPWSEAEESGLGSLVLQGMPAEEIARKIGRTTVAVVAKVKQLKRRAAGHLPLYATRRIGPFHCNLS